MTPGLRLAAAARRILRHETFALMVSPAIADLQFEARDADMSTLVRGYAGVARALTGGLLHDLRDDLRVLCDDAFELTQIVGMQVCYYAAMLTVIGGAGVGHLSTSNLLVLATTLLCLAVTPTLICFWPDRYDHDIARD